MFISLRSPRGGNPLASLWAGIRKDQNIKLEPEKRPEIVEDFAVFKIGYLSDDLKKGSPIYIKRSDAKRLKGLMLHELLD
jgi:hypothetical protein